MKYTLSLNKNTLFRRLYYRGEAFSCKYFVIYIMKTKANVNRLGFTVSKKIGKAVKRNRVRRLLYEAYRLYEPSVKIGYYMVIVARSATLDAKFSDIHEKMGAVLQKAGLISNND